MTKEEFFGSIRDGLIVSCYADSDYNQPFAEEAAMLALARSVERGGAAALRINLRHVAALKQAIRIPLIGIHKVYRGAEMRITPTLQEVEALVDAGADAIAVDATFRPRFDDLTLERFVAAIHRRFGICVIADVATFDEGVAAAEARCDAVGTTLSGYTPASPSFGRLGDIPPPEPDYQLIEQLVRSARVPVIAEGRFNTPEKAAAALERGAHAVVVGTAISNPEKITALFRHAIVNRGPWLERGAAT